MIDAADLAEDPPGIRRAYCRTLALPFIPEALEWNAELPEAWRDVGGWHADLAGSNGIAGPRAPAAPGLDAAPHLRNYYDHRLPFYRKMRAHRLTPDSRA